MPAGQPKKYKTAEELQEKIEEYFKDAVFDKNGDERDIMKPVTVAGLAYHLGFASRQSLWDYEQKSEYSYTIKKAKLFIESYLETRLLGNNVTGVIFNLKNNFGWMDKLEVSPGKDKDGKPEKWEIEFISK